MQKMWAMSKRLPGGPGRREMCIRDSITEKLKRDNSLLGSFKKDPVKAVREFLGEIDLPDDCLLYTSRCV